MLANTVLVLFICSMKVVDVFSACDPTNNDGVYKEFGPIPFNIRDPVMVRQGSTSDTMALDGPLDRYKVQYNEFTAVRWSTTYSFLTLYYWDTKTYTFVVLDFLRVDSSRWRKVQEAFLEASAFANYNRKIKVKFLTKDCSCVQRVYDLSSADIPSGATTLTCDGEPLTTPLHRTTMVAKPPSDYSNKITQELILPDCDVNNNVGVLDVFGVLPTNLLKIEDFYEVMDNGDYHTKLKLWQDYYLATYSEYKSKGGSESYTIVKLYYHEDKTYKLLDNLRVNPDKWKNIEGAILNADTNPDSYKKLRVKYLTADCKCVMRVYDLSLVDIVGEAMSKSCDNLNFFTPPTRGTVAEEQKNLQNANKATFMQWKQKKEMPATKS